MKKFDKGHKVGLEDYGFLGIVVENNFNGTIKVSCTGARNSESWRYPETLDYYEKYLIDETFDNFKKKIDKEEIILL